MNSLPEFLELGNKLLHTKNKLRVPQVLSLVNFFMKLPGNGVGGSLHIVLCDPNWEDHYVEYCIEYAQDHSDVPGELLGCILLKMSYTQRKSIYEKLEYA